MTGLKRTIGSRGQVSVSIGYQDIEDMSFRELKESLIGLALEMEKLEQENKKGFKALNVMDTIKANVVNRKLSDSQFRQFVISTLLSKEECELAANQEFTPELQDKLEEELCGLAGELQLNGVSEERIIDQVREKFEENKIVRYQPGARQ